MRISLFATVVLCANFWTEPLLAGSPQSEQNHSRVISTAADPVPPKFKIWENHELNGFIKPVIQISSSLVLYRPITVRTNVEYTERLSTLLLSRIGFEGTLFGFLDFRTVFERNLGFAISPNGPTGTSVWEGNASWQARESYLRLRYRGLSLTAGIAPDPNTVDYISDNILDSFGMDPFVRDPLLASGFSQGQTIILQYQPADTTQALGVVKGLKFGLGLTSGNPLISSLSVGFGGEINRLGSIFDNPRRAISNGVPGSNIQMTVFTPGLSYERSFRRLSLGIKAAAQWFWVDPDITQKEDAQLRGTNYRSTAFISIFDNNLRLFGGFSVRENDNADLDNVEQLSDSTFYSTVQSAGLDLSLRFLNTQILRNFGIGANYYRVYRQLAENFQNTGEADDFTFHYINIGLTYPLYPGVLFSSVRFSRFIADATQESSQPLITNANNVIVALRLVI